MPKCWQDSHGQHTSVIIQLEDWKVSKRPLNLTFLKCHTKCLKAGVFLETPQQRYNSSALSQGSVEGPLRNLLLPYKAESFVKYLSSSFYRTTLLHVALRPDSGSRPLLTGFAITLIRHTTLGRTPMDEWPARCRDLYLTTHNTHKRQTSMLPTGFEPSSATSKRSSNVMSRLRAVRPVNRSSILSRSRYLSILHKVQTEFEAHPASCPRICFPRDNAVG